MSVVDLGFDPDADWRAWLRRYEWHLDQIPPLVEAMRLAVYPLGAMVYDRVRVDVSRDGSPLPLREGAVDDADDLWAELVQYTANVVDLLGVPWRSPLRRSWRSRGDVAGMRADADPLSARREAMEIVGWLVDAAPTVVGFAELAESEESLFARIRGARARYTVATVRRAAPRLCGVCGERAVRVSWVDGLDGSPKPIQVVACSLCGAGPATKLPEVG